MKNSLVFFLIILVGIGCGKTTTFGPKEKQEVTSEVKEMLNNYLNAMKSDGLMSEFDYLDNSSEFFWVPPGFNSPLSYDSVKRIIEQNAKAVKTVEYQYDSLLIIPLSPDIANYSAILSGHLIDTAGINSPVRLIESGVLIKRENGWKLLSGQSALLPLPNN